MPYDALLELLERLRRELDIGVDQLLAVQQLLARLAERGALPTELGELKYFIGPVLCRGAAEQEEFAERFDAWVEEQRALHERDARDERRRAKHEAPAGANAEVRALRRRRLWWQLAIGALTLGVCVLLVPRFVAREEPVTRFTPAPVPAPPVPPLPSATPDVPGAYRLSLLREIRRTQPVPLSHTRVHELFSLVLLLAMVLGWLGWRLRAWLEARRFLGRDASARPSGFDALVVGVDAAGLREPALRPLANVLRAREQVSASELDVDATITATAQAGGMLRTIERSRKRLPDYLALIERAGLHDVQAALVDDWLEQLRSQDVAVARYYFEREPRYLVAAGSESAQPVWEVQATTRDHRVLVFSDGRHLLNPLTGQVRASVEELSLWPQRALVTPEPIALWSRRERLLTESGLAVFGTSASGLAATRGANVQPGLAPGEDSALPQALPRFLQERERLWLHPDAPPQGDLERVIAALRTYLGPEGFDWLAACALYPQIRWQLVVGLGSSLRDADQKPLLDRARLLRMARLPWLRAGFMPDWLRSALLLSLPTERAREARDALRELLISALVPGKLPLLLEIARRDEGSMRALWRRLTRGMRKQAGAADAVHDRVFTRWMSDGLGVRMPGTLGRRLRAVARQERDIRAVPPSLAASVFGAAAIAVLVMAGWTALVLFILDKLFSSFDDLGAVSWTVLLGAGWWLQTELTLLRWRRFARLERAQVRRRVLIDGLAPSLIVWCLMLLAIASQGKLPSDGGAVLAALGGVAALVALISWLRARAVASWNGHGGRAPALRAVGRWVDVLMPDRWLFRTRPEPLPPATPLKTALAALAVAPCSAGLAVPLYCALHPLRALAYPARGRVLRALYEITLCCLPLIVGYAVDIPSFRYPEPTLIGWGASCLFTYAWLRLHEPAPSSRWLSRILQPAVRAGRWLDRWSPDRIELRLLIVPLFAVGLGSIVLQTWNLRRAVADVATPVLQSLWGWPTEPANFVSAGLSADGSEVMTASKSGSVWIESVTAGETPREHTIRGATDLTYVEVAAHGRFMLAVGDQARTIVRDDLLIKTAGSDVGIAHLRGDSWLVYSERNVIRVVDQLSKSTVTSIDDVGLVNELDMTDDARRLVYGSSEGLLTVRDREDPMRPIQLAISGQRVSNVRLSPDGSRVVGVVDYDRLESWSLDERPGEGLTSSSGRLIGKPDGAIVGVEFAPDGAIVVVTSFGEVLLQPIEGEPSRLFPDDYRARTVAFSRDGTRLVSIDYEHTDTARVFRVERVPRAAKAPTAGHILSPAAE